MTVVLETLSVLFVVIIMFNVILLKIQRKLLKAFTKPYKSFFGNQSGK